MSNNSWVRKVVAPVSGLAILCTIGILSAAPISRATAAPALASYIEICFESGDCFVVEGSCDGWCPNAPFAPTCTTQSMAVAGSFLEWNSVGRKAALVTPDKTWPVASDKMSAFIKKMKKTYAKSDKNDEELQGKISKEFMAFRKKDKGVVSYKRLQGLSKTISVPIKRKRQ